MTIIEKINGYQQELKTSSLKRDRAIILEMGTELKTIRRKELEIYDSLILQIENFLDEINEKWFGAETKFSEEVEDFFIEVRGMAMNLGGRTEGQDIDNKYYSSVQKLGRQLINLSSMLKAFVIPLATVPFNHTLWG